MGFKKKCTQNKKSNPGGAKAQKIKKKRSSNFFSRLVKPLCTNRSKQTFFT